MTKGLRIGELSRLTGIPTQTIRYYEQLGLLNPPDRTESNYRLYKEADVARLEFITKAKLFDLTLEEISELITLNAEGVAPCERLEELVQKHLDALDRRIQEMISFRQGLAVRYEQVKTRDAGKSGATICGIIEAQSLPSTNKE